MDTPVVQVIWSMLSFSSGSVHIHTRGVNRKSPDRQVTQSLIGLLEVMALLFDYYTVLKMLYLF